MSTPTLLRFAKGVLAVVCGLALTSCADLATTGSGPAYLILENMTASAGGGAGGTSSLKSDVEVIVDVTIGGATVQVPQVFNDTGTASIRAAMKNTQVTATAPTPINTITINRYRVRYRRTDGRNVEGVDVPYGFEGAMTATVSPGNSTGVNFDLVRHQSKLEAPLLTLRGGRGLIFLSTIAEVTFYGQDQAGNAVSVVGTIDVQFADFGDQ